MECLRYPLLVILMLVSAVGVCGDKTREQKLGKLLFTDKDLSLNRNQSCHSCHSLKPVRVSSESMHGNGRHRLQPAAPFAHPDNIRRGTVVAEGSIRGQFGSLNSPGLSYVRFVPQFRWDGGAGWVGGLFWDGRAENLFEQAGAPILNPVEMAMPSEWAVVSRLQENPRYIRKFLNVYDIDLEAIPSYELAPSDVTPPPGVYAAFDAASKAIAAFQESTTFNKFNSKYDYVVAGMTSFSAEEQAGFELFNGKALCSVCHRSDISKAPDGSDFPALFSGFIYQNIGVPVNDNIPGNGLPNEGIGGREDISIHDINGELIGAFRTSGLRNIELTPPYMHNGVFKSLEEVVHFYNSRDVKDRTCSSVNDPGYSVDCWPEAEFPENMVVGVVGNLNLSSEEEENIVAFLRTLTDNYPKWGNSNGLSDPAISPGTPSPFDNVSFP